MVPTPEADDPPNPPVTVELEVVPPWPAFAPTTTAEPPMVAQFDVELHNHASADVVPLTPLDVPPMPPRGTLTPMVLAGMSGTFVPIDVAPAPPPPPGLLADNPAAPPPPGAVTFMELLLGLKHLSSVMVVLEVGTFCVNVPPGHP